MKAPPPFLPISGPGAEGWVRPEAREWVERWIHRTPTRTLYDEASLASDTLLLQGRGRVYAIPAPNRHRSGTRDREPDSSFPREGAARRDENVPASGTPRWVVRHYYRGGLLAPLLRDRFVRPGARALRPFRELEASQVLRKRGVQTPRVIAAVVYPSGLFYGGDLVTEFLPQATDLAAILFDLERGGVGGTLERRDALAESGRLIRRVAEAGALHRDLNVKNILLEWPGAAPTAYLLDLDRCSLLKKSPAALIEKMLGRLLRSLRKWEKATKMMLPLEERRVLETAARRR